MNYTYDTESKNFIITHYVDPFECEIGELHELYHEVNRKLLIVQIRLAKFFKLKDVPTIIVENTKEQVEHLESVRDRIVDFIIERKTSDSPEDRLLDAIFNVEHKKKGKKNEKDGRK